MCLAGLDPSLGCEVGWLRVNHDAFADDIAWFATTPRGLQALASKLETQLSLCGLSISSGPQGKSASLCLDIDGKVKKWVTQVYRYLGVDVSPYRTKANVAGMLRDGLVSILWAPLKPQQRLYIATYHLLPTCQHQLALAPTSTKFLRWLYKTVRSAPTVLVEGALGVPLHEHVVPFMQAKRLSRLDASPDPAIATMCSISQHRSGHADPPD